MTFAVSHIAWTPAEEPEALALLSELDIPLLEVAPGRFLGESEIGKEVPPTLQAVQDAGLGIAGFQAILFGKPELKLFGDSTSPALLGHLKRLASACSSVGGKYLVFGAPQSRWIPDTMSPESAFATAVEFFAELGRQASLQGVVIGVEANPAAYGCNFCTHAADVAHLVRAVNSPGVGWHLDTGELAMNNEKLPDVIADHADLICSVHVSEPNLGDFASPWEGHPTVAASLRKASYHGIISLEMKRPESGLTGVRLAIEKLVSIYS